MDTLPEARSFHLTLGYTHRFGRFRPYFEALQLGQMVAWTCPDCGQAYLSPQRICPADRTETRLAPLSGSFTLHSLTVGNAVLPLNFGAELCSFGLVEHPDAAGRLMARIMTAGGLPPLGAALQLCQPGDSAPDHPIQALVFTTA
jgi:uncharacterized OB-fold protein